MVKYSWDWLCFLSLICFLTSCTGKKTQLNDGAPLLSSDTLISSEDFEAFRRNRDYSERSVLQFAKEQGIAPGIVVGRMQLEGMIKYSMLNNLKEKYEIAV